MSGERFPGKQTPMLVNPNKTTGISVARIMTVGVTVTSTSGSMAQLIGRTVRIPDLGTMFATRHVHSSRKRGRHTSNLWAARLACALQARGQGPLPFKAKP